MFYGIIDIGSNAIRAVIYKGKNIDSHEVYNDRFRSDIRSLLKYDNIDIKHQSYLIIQYFIHIFKQFKVLEVKCVATAVLRGHPKAAQFQEIVKLRYGITIEILSGEEEAYLTAAGLIIGISDVGGIAADLGGGSLELVEIDKKVIGKRKSLVLGTRVLSKREDIGFNDIKEQVKREFGNVEYQNLYLIGGAFRLIGRLYMEFINYPPISLHNFRVKSSDILLSLAKLDSISKINPDLHGRKIDINAIIILQVLIEVFHVKTVIVSNYGLKEGVHFANLSPKEKSKDIIYERCSKLVCFEKDSCDIEKYINLILPLLIPKDKFIEKIIEQAVILASCGRNTNMLLRANFMPEYILTSGIPFSHRQRAMLALILSHSFYNLKSESHISKLSKIVLSKRDFHNSIIIGNIISIAKDIDGPKLGQPSFRLSVIDKKFVQLDVDQILPKPVFEKVCKKLKK